MKLRSTCLVCGQVFEKEAGDVESIDRIAESMVSYLARRHREKTGHTTSPIVRHAERLPPIRVTFDVKKID
jgi:hypothetical protein